MIVIAQSTSTPTAIDPQVWAALLGALAGAVVTFVLTEASTWLRDRREQLRLKESARTALRFEIADNLALLQVYWSQVATRKDGTINAGKTAAALVGSAAPNWNDAIWRGFSATIVLAFSSKEIEGIYRLYSVLADITKTQQRLIDTENTDTAREAAADTIYTGLSTMPTVRAPVPQFYLSMVKSLIPPLDERISLVLSQGNPIRD